MSVRESVWRLRAGGSAANSCDTHCCVAVDEPRSSLEARCVSFYRVVCVAVCLLSFRV